MKKIVALVAVSLLAVSVLAVSNVSAAGDPTQFSFHVSNRFIQIGTEIPQTGARAQADNGDFVSVTGRGLFNIATGRVFGGGAFLHTNQQGDVLGYGSWKGEGVLDFDFYGCAPPPEGLPSNFCGGLLTLDVRLRGVSPTTGAALLDGVLTIDCLIGPNVPEGHEEVITLDIPDLINFDDGIAEPGGLNLFVARN
jgi:hypothetical protein